MVVTEFRVDVIKKKCVAIVRFGPLTANDGYRAGEYFQVTIDPDKVSPSGEFIRFGTTDGDEIVGWQRCAAMSVVEILGEWVGGHKPLLQYGTGADGVTMMIAEAVTV
jgi:hypothetical protein